MANRAGITTHVRAQGIQTACGQNINTSKHGNRLGLKIRSVPLALAPDGTTPTCQRCRAKVSNSTRPEFNRQVHRIELARHPGASWRFQTGGSLAIESQGATSNSERFDEVVVDDWLHAEMMDARSCFVQVAGLAITLKLTKSGAVVTNVEVRENREHERQNLLRLLGNEAQADNSDENEGGHR